MLDVRRMRVLREVAQRGSFSAAADALAYTQSAVSQQIAALEREAGTRLVERNARGVRLTDAGRALVVHADAILARLADAEAELEAIAGLRGGRLRLAAFPSAGATIMPEAIARFRARHPAVELTLEPADPEPALVKLRSGDADLVLDITGAFRPLARGRHRARAPARRPDVRRAAAGPSARPQAQPEARGARGRVVDPRHDRELPGRVDLPALLPARRVRSARRRSTATTTSRSRASSPRASGRRSSRTSR